MSTRYARTADRASNEKYAKILKSLLQKPSNKYCADCKKKDARWASWNLGIFVCIRCSGIHRSLGVHISKVKSVDLDTWVQDQVENMVRWGNERANKYWEANLKDRKPTESNMEMWIRAKYEQKRWAMKGPIPDPSTLGGEDDEVTQVSSAASSANQSPAPQKQQIEKPKPKQSEFANLDAFLSSPSSSPAISHQAKPTASQQLQGADFFFGSNTASSSTTTTATTTPADTQQTTQNQKHNDFKSSILSLYNNMPAANPSPQQYNGNFHNQMAGLSLGNNQPQQPQQQHQQFNNSHSNNNNNNNNNMWGSFAAATPIQPQQSQQPQQPQGSQFFSSSSSAPKKPERDVFADLLG
ncbi:hypothetical protein HPULCUR_005630 [Helicostylum pulchrum]|uniref:Arf-GAP domain-containing protein n=1 Tax=Helicostylum pulchrum TaxID=562976 RepID=A0ABP9XZM0_9FUNG